MASTWTERLPSRPLELSTPLTSRTLAVQLFDSRRVAGPDGRNGHGAPPPPAHAPPGGAAAPPDGQPDAPVMPSLAGPACRGGTSVGFPPLVRPPHCGDRAGHSSRLGTPGSGRGSAAGRIEDVRPDGPTRRCVRADGQRPHTGPKRSELPA